MNTFREQDVNTDNGAIIIILYSYLDNDDDYNALHYYNIIKISTCTQSHRMTARSDLIQFVHKKCIKTGSSYYHHHPSFEKIIYCSNNNDNKL